MLMIIAVLVALAIIAASTAAGLANEFRAARLLHPNIEHGRTLYSTCITCHGADGRGRAKDGIPAIAGQHYRYALEQLTDFREAERIDLRMNAMAASHALKKLQSLADVAAYVADLEPRPTDDKGPGQMLTAGQNLYGRACSHCHGDAAQGDGKLGYPRLAGQHYSYLLRQMEIMRVGDRPNVTWEHMKLLESVTPEELSGVAGYLARLEGTHHAAAAAADARTSITASRQR
jgi:cytochrome c553